MTFKNKTFQKLISSLLIFSILLPAGFVLFSKPKKAEAIPVIVTTDIERVVKEIIVEILKVVAQRLLDKMTQSTINWINNGFHGKPLFVENPGSFFRDVAKVQVKGFVDLTAYDKLKFPFGRDYALGIIDRAKNGGFAQNAAYSYSKLTNDPIMVESFKNEFSVGGWNGFLLNTQLPQNNFIGYGIIADNELANQIESETTKIKDSLNQSLGFLSPEICKSNPNWDADKFAQGYQKPPYNPPSGNATDPDYQRKLIEYDTKWNAEVSAGQANFQAQYGCPEGASITTPGSVVSNQIMMALGSKQRQGELGAALGNSLSAIFDALLNHFFSKGLSDLSDFSQPAPGPKIDDFNYIGDTTGNIPWNTGSALPKLTITKTVVNDDHGELKEKDIVVLIDGDAARITTSDLYSVGVGDHIISATAVEGYEITIGGDCSSDGSIKLAIGSSKVCTVTFDDK